MSSLVEDPSSRSNGSSRSELPYIWLLPGIAKTAPMEIGDGTDFSGLEMDAKSLLSASIGHELLISLITAFGDTIFSHEHDAKHENLTMICDLSSKIYRNQKMLCMQFWSDWDAYTSTHPPATTPALVRIVDLAFSLNSDGNVLSRDEALSTLALQMQLLSTLCTDADNVEFAFGTIHPNTLQRSLQYLGETNGQPSEEFSSNKFRFLNSLYQLTQLGDTISCRDMMRGALGETGPHMLLKTLSSCSDSRCKECTLNIAANLLLQDAPVMWTATYARGMQTLLSPNFFEASEGFGIARVFHAMVLSLPAVASSEQLSDSDVDSFLDLIWRGVLFLCPLLAQCLSNVTRDSPPLKTVIATLEFFSSLLENIAPLALTRLTASRIRTAMVELMSSHMGESVMFYALLPVSLSIAHDIDSYTEEQKLHYSAGMQENNASGKYGLWHSTATGGSVLPRRSAETNAEAKDMVTNAAASFDVASEKSGEDSKVLTSVVSKALALLRLWAVNVQNCVMGDSTASSLNYEQKERLVSLSPQKLLVALPALPNPLRTKGTVKDLWESVGLTNFQLLTRYIEGDVWPFSISALSLDVFHACASHMKWGGAQESLKDLIPRSNVFDSVSSLAMEEESNKSGDVDKTGTRVLCILALRFASAILEVLPADENTNALGNKMVKAAFRGAETACDKFHKFREAKGKLGVENESLLDDLLHGVSCLCFLRAVWDDASRLEGSLKITQTYSDESAAFTALTKVLLQHAHLESEMEPSVVGFVNSLLASVTDFLRLSATYARRNEQTKNCTMMRMVQENSLPLISMPKNFMSVDAMLATSGNTLVESLPEKFAFSAAPQSLFDLFPIFAVGDANFDFFNTNVAAMAASLPPSRDGTGALTDVLFATALPCYSLSSQVALSVQWRKLAMVLLSQISAPRSESHKHQYLLAAQEVLRVLHDNATKIESAATYGSFLRPQDLSEIAQSSVSLVLVLLSASEICTSYPSNPGGVAAEVLELISASSSKVLNILEQDVAVCCQVGQHLLTAAIGVLMSLDQGDIQPSSSSSDLKDAVDLLVGTTSRLLTLIDAKSDGDSDCLKTCIVLITMLAAEDGIDIPGGKSSLAKRLKDLNLVDAVVRRVGVYAQPEQHMATERESGDDVGIAVLESFVDLIQASESSEMLELVYNSGALQLLTRNVYVQRATQVWNIPPTAPNTSFRGYISTKKMHSPPDTKDKAFFKEDAHHRLWRKTISCFRSLCRATRQSSLQTPVATDRLQALPLTSS